MAAAPNHMPHLQYSYSSATTNNNHTNSQSQGGADRTSGSSSIHYSNQETDFTGNYDNLDDYGDHITPSNNNADEVVPYHNGGAGVGGLAGDHGVQTGTGVGRARGHKFAALPAGFRFLPTDWELVGFYLFNRVHGLPLPALNHFFEANIYEDSPDSITAKYPNMGGNRWFFFTPRDRKYPQGGRPKRTAGDGFWKATGANRIITGGPRGEELGFRKSLAYHKGKPSSGERTEWLMHEFWLKNPPLPAKAEANNMRLDDCVLCKIYLKPGTKKSPTPKSKKRARGESEEDGGIAPNDGEVEEDSHQNVAHGLPNHAAVAGPSHYSQAELNRLSQPYPFRAEYNAVPFARLSPNQLPSIQCQFHLQKNNGQQVLDSRAFPSESYSVVVANATGGGAIGGLQGGVMKPVDNIDYLPYEFSFPSSSGVPETEDDDFLLGDEFDFISPLPGPAQNPGNSP
ncbi:OLC1v1028074C1 [Oldenlandia corymbosa var. corymbosa]|uniref:OLC1v1028074C1 n=1 Tax=Oldenlandia corymbosa var. corymbosa TaxID=529605 RepID=A0AAV1CC22_OLDCO|nr:OLC1v1028074C1 [Oldenlandia corymbosa var. corymbosa]